MPRGSDRDGRSFPAPAGHVAATLELGHRAAGNARVGRCAPTGVRGHAAARPNLLGIPEAVLQQRRSRVNQGEVAVGDSAEAGQKGEGRKDRPFHGRAPLVSMTGDTPG